jgi:hypothetical protein
MSKRTLCYIALGVKIVSAIMNEHCLMRTILSCVLCMFITASLFAQNIIEPIPGWDMDNSNGQYIFTSPGGDLKYMIMPPQAARSGDLTQWVKQLAVKDLKASGYTTSPSLNRPVAKYVQAALTYTVTVTDQQNTKLGVTYLAYERPDNTVRYAKMIWQPGKMGKSLGTAAQHFATLLKKETEQTQGTGTTSNTSAKPNSVVTEDPVVDPPMAAPGKGSGTADIRGVVLHAETGVGVGGSATVVYVPYILFKNGTLYERPDISPSDLDVTRSKQQEPEKWGSWKISGKTLTVNHGSKKGQEARAEQWQSGWWYWAVPATANEKLNASYSSLTGGGNSAMGGGITTVSSANVTFNNKGQFTYESTGGGTSGSSTAYANKSKAGTYKLNGFSIELKFNNGSTSRQIFYFVDDTKRSFGLGSRTYILSK